MKKIVLISDNHGYEATELLPFVKEADEIWHAGDIGSLNSIKMFEKNKPFKAVYGNIDDADTRMTYPLRLSFECEGLKILITHIGGYPGKYPASIKKWILDERADVFICGHSHICKVMYDSKLNHWHFNPGSYGHHGFHHIRTALSFTIDDKKISDLSVIELGKRGRETNEMTIK